MIDRTRGRSGFALDDDIDDDIDDHIDDHIDDDIRDRCSAMSRHVRNFGRIARSALPRWLRAFFSSLDSSALVRPSGSTSSGS